MRLRKVTFTNKVTQDKEGINKENPLYKTRDLLLSIIIIPHSPSRSHVSPRAGLQRVPGVPHYVLSTLPTHRAGE